MKKILAAVFLAFVAYAAAVFYAGRGAENTLAERAALIAESELFETVSRRYERGFFGSEETWVVRVKPHVLRRFGRDLPEVLRDFLREPLTLHSRIRHGPVVGGKALRASAETEVIFSDRAKRTVKQLFGEATPITVRDDIAWDGSGNLKIVVSPFDYRELSGIRWLWRGLTSNTRYRRGYTDYDSDWLAPGMTLTLADAGEISWKNLSYDSRRRAGDIMPEGNAALRLEAGSIRWNHGVDYRIRLNDIINTLTDLQLGGFINPSAQPAPAEISAEGFSLDTSLAVTDGFADAEGRLKLKTLNYGSDRYQNLDIEAVARHIDARALRSLKAALAAGDADDDETWREQVLKAVRNEGAGIFTGDPTIELRRFRLDAPSGEIAVDADLSFRGVEVEDLNDINRLLPKMRLRARFDVPRSLPEDFAQNQILSIFRTDNEEDLRDMRQTIAAMVKDNLETMAREEYVRLDGERLSGSLKAENRRFFMNDREVIWPDYEAEESENPSDEETAEDLPASAASEPSQPNPQIIEKENP